MKSRTSPREAIDLQKPDKLVWIETASLDDVREFQRHVSPERSDWRRAESRANHLLATGTPRIHWVMWIIVGVGVANLILAIWDRMTS